LAARECRGEILVEFDHDDELLAQALELIVAAFEADLEVDFVYSDWVDWRDTPDGEAGLYPAGWGFGFGAYASEMIDGRRLPVALAPPLTWETIRHIVAAPNHVRAWRSAFYRDIGGHDSRLAVADDYDLVLRTFLTGTAARIPRPLYRQHHDPQGSNASRRHNAEIQRRVHEIADRERGAIDQRCLSLGLIPSPPSPLTGWQPICAANKTIDPIAAADARRGEPLVSVVVPTYRRPRAFARALESILAQSYRNLEVVVVGDACPLLEDVMASIDDPRVRHWNLSTHYGDGGASPRNYALKTMARGTLIAYLDDDNRWQPDHLDSIVELLRDRGPMFAFASLTMGGEEIICRRPRRMQIDTSALVHQRSLLERFGYWRPGATHDWELVSRWRDESWSASLKPSVIYTLSDAHKRARLLEVVRTVAEEERQAAISGRDRRSYPASTKS
ncbi:MAG: glycosyltransferase, partial [Solirubrobacterales bacterium]|nr:glycosyltransferase [Solirubrobacterales bacterium]